MAGECQLVIRHSQKVAINKDIHRKVREQQESARQEQITQRETKQNDFSI